ncbi:MAG: hypothetical protein IKW89_05950 [Bacteroidales bacterium]|nr:hypothetical protein [Bacteroidales bacterium]
MITGYRSLLQASIDDKSAVLNRLVFSVPELIHRSFVELEDNAHETALKNSDGEMEIYFSIYHNESERYRPEDEEWMITEFYRSMVLNISSFAETTIKSLLQNPDERFHGNYLFNAFNKLNEESYLQLDGISTYWEGHQDFTQKRNDIAHNCRDVDITAEELYDAINGVHRLLRAIADALNLRTAEGRSHSY